jgi:hypothetical protein
VLRANAALLARGPALDVDLARGIELSSTVDVQRALEGVRSRAREPDADLGCGLILGTLERERHCRRAR